MMFAMEFLQDGYPGCTPRQRRNAAVRLGISFRIRERSASQGSRPRERVHMAHQGCAVERICTPSSRCSEARDRDELKDKTA